MRWGITFLAWVLTGLYLSTTCLDYVRVWQNPPPGYTQERPAWRPPGSAPAAESTDEKPMGPPAMEIDPRRLEG
jgi:hypothetical protein